MMGDVAAPRGTGGPEGERPRYMDHPLLGSVLLNIDYVYSVTREQWFKTGEVVFLEGEPGDAAFLLVEGELEAYVDVGGKDHRVSVIHPGDFFGEMAAIDQGERSASVRALTDATVRVLPREAFIDLCLKHPDTALGILLRLSISLRDMTADMKRRLSAAARGPSSG